MTSSTRLCQLPECQVETTGKCHLGNDPVESCPNYAQDNNSVEPADLPLDPAEGKAAPIEICSGDVMRREDVTAFVLARSIRSVALVGEQRAGKTTLLASIYEMYCKGPFAGLSFAGSKTLVGFAKRHHLALLNSERTTPTTPRTSRDDEVVFFHLALARSTREIVDVVISDRSGEAYGDARIDTSLIPTLSELYQAERVCFLLDGAKFASKEQRPAYSRQFKQMIHALADNGALANVKVVEVLATKFDVTSHGEAEDQIKFLTQYESQISDEFAGHGLNLRCYRVCALPKTDVSIGFVGLEDMVRRWTNPISLPSISPVPISDLPRQIDRLLAKGPGGRT